MKAYIVTGGSAGLGAAIVKILLNQNRTVYSISRSKPIEGCSHLKADLSSPNEAEKAMSNLFEELDMSDLSSLTLINNAGKLSPIQKIVNAASSDALENLNVNILSPVILTKEFIRLASNLHSQKTVINISSGAALKAYDGWSLYCAAKAGLEHFGRCVAKEQLDATYPVKVINFNPGVMDTEMQATIRKSSKAEFSSLERFLNLHKNQQLSSPDAVAKVLIRLLENDLETGATYNYIDLI